MRRNGWSTEFLPGLAETLGFRAPIHNSQVSMAGTATGRPRPEVFPRLWVRINQLAGRGTGAWGQPLRGARPLSPS